MMKDATGLFLLIIALLILIGTTGSAGKLEGQSMIAKQCAFDGSFQVGNRHFMCQHIKQGAKP